MIRRSVWLRRSVEKTLPDLVVLLEGRLPGFVYGGEVRGLPVFTYHVIGPEFARDLELLHRGGYRTAGAEELAAHAVGRAKADGRTVALTFDDGDASLVRTAAPLLADHGFRAIAFVVSGLVPDVTNESLAGWIDLRTWVARGTLEIGSHSLYHHHVAVSPEVVGFVDPATETHFTANIPIARLDGPAPPPPGTPIYRSQPRYVARMAFRPDPGGLDRLREFVRERESAFFGRPGWHRELARLAPRTGSWETASEADDAVVSDMARSVERIARQCPNRAQSHLCYPWYARTRRADALAGRAGMSLLLGGITVRDRARRGEQPPLLQRLPPDLLWRLPGPARRSLGAVVWGRARTTLRRTHYGREL